MPSSVNELLHYLDDQRAVLRAAVASVPEAQHHFSPAEGRWSVANVLEHLAVVETRIAAMLRPKIAEARATGETTGGESAATSARPIDLSRLLDRTRPVQASAASQPSGALDSAGALAALDQSREAMRETVRGTEGAPLHAVRMPHPVLGPLDLDGWIRFVGAHEARHAAQILEIGASLGARA